MKIIDNLQLLNRLKRFASGYTTIHNLNDLAIEVEAVLDDLIDIEFSGLYLYDFHENKLKLLVAKGFNDEELREAERTGMERHPGYVFRTREILNIPDTENDPEHRSISSERSFIVRSRLYVPVMNGDQAVGAFGIVSSEKNHFNDETVAILSFICNIAGGIYGNIMMQVELRLASLIAQETDNAVIITGKDGLTEWVNRSFERITGYKFEEVKGIKPGEILQGDDTDQQIVNKIAEAVNMMIPIEADLVNYHKNGRPYWVRLQIQPVFNAQGELTNFISIQRDITDQKKAQNEMESITMRLATLITNMNSGILVEDQYRNIALINKTFCNMFSIPVEPEALLGSDCSDSANQSKQLFLDPDYFVNRIDIILREKKPVIGEEIELADNRIFERDYIPIFLDQKFLGNLWQYSDISSRKKIENDLRKATTEAESANSSKSLFLAKMSHEIRTPLNAVIGLSKLLYDTSLTSEQKKLNDKLLISGENLLGIINEILDFSKIEAGKIEMEAIPFSLQKMIRRVYSSLEHTAEEKMITLTTSVDQRIGRALIGDPVRLQQVLTNLVSNAIKFTQTGGVEVSCKLIDETETKTRLLFSVTDSGIGISKENLNYIFERFRQEDDSVTRIYGGTGLGLAISKQLVNLMDGELQVESEKGKGSRFFFTLEFMTTDEKALQKEDQKVKFDPAALKNKKILIVEDNEFNQFIVKSLIEKWGASTEIAENGTIAVKNLKQTYYDIVLMDMQMPEMDGVTATRIIRSEINKNIPIFALTANVTKEAIQRAYDAGMNEYITKPFDEEDLYIKLLKAVGIEPEFYLDGTNPPEIYGSDMQQDEIHYDLSKLFRFLGNNKKQSHAMIVKFLQYIPEYYKALIDAYEADDFENILQTSHKIKSSLDLIATQSIRDTINLIYLYANEKQNLDKLPNLFELIKIKFPLMIAQLEKWIEDNPQEA